MYEPPLEIMEFNPLNTIMEKMLIDKQTHQEEWFFQQIKNYGVNVDKKELIKALNYDRQQYQKGYADGIKEFVGRLNEHVASLEFNVKTPRKTVPLQTLYDQVNWILTEIIPKTIDGVLEEMVGDSK